MPGFTIPHSLRYPVPTDPVKDASVLSRLASDIQALAESANTAIGVEGERAESSAIAKSAVDAAGKYGGLSPQIGETNSRIDQTNNLVTQVSGAASANGSNIAIHEDRILSLEEAAGFGAGSVNDATSADLIASPATLTNAALRTQVGQLFGLNAATEGVVGDGIADDTETFWAAANKAATFGLPLILNGGMSVGIAAYKLLPAGLTLHTNGAKFKQIAVMNRAPVIALSSNSTVVGGLDIEVLGGAGCQGLSINGQANIAVDWTEVNSPTEGTSSGNIRDNGVFINNSSNINIGRIKVKNFDWPVYVEGVPFLTIGWMEADTYSKGLHLEDVPHCRIGGGWVHGTSPNASYLPGYNGILMEASISTRDVRIENFLVEDSMEHGFRISGPAQQTDIWASNCMARNVGGTGFKVLGGVLADGIYNENITLDNCTVEDAGQINQNTCGFLIQMCNYVRLINPAVRKRSKAYSAVEGIRLSGVSHVTITSPKIMDFLNFGIHIDEAFGNVADVKVNGAHIQSATGHSVYLQNPGVDFRDIEIDAFVENTSATGSAFYAGRYTAPTDSGTWSGFNRIALRVSDTMTTALINPNSSTNGIGSFYADIIGKKAGTFVFKNGSEWLDSNTGTKHLAKAGAWVAL